jgi:hypothetical protein
MYMYMYMYMYMWCGEDNSHPPAPQVADRGKASRYRG